MHHVGLSSGTSKSSKFKNPSFRLKILTYESHESPSETLGADPRADPI